MTVAVFFGCTFIAFGPAVALFVFTIARDPLRVIFLIGFLLAGVFVAVLSCVVHHSSDQQQEQCHSADRAAHFRGCALCSASGGFQIWLLQIAEVRINCSFSVFERSHIFNKPKYNGMPCS
uniref:Gamma-secretase subunit APH-1 n=1 Tax=Sinocyclocheilus grahami TaxID=75366 RepID=A0A672NY65_SINGR